MTSADRAKSEEVLILAPTGRDAAIAAAILKEAGLPARICPDLATICSEMEAGAGVVVVAEEAVHNADLTALSHLIATQPAWSDFPFVVLALRNAGLERNPGAKRLQRIFGNVSFLERPFHPTTLVSIIETALRGRRRQYEARERIEEIREAEALLEQRVVERTVELEAANRQLATQITEREKAESALRQSQRLEAVGQLTSGVAHDFNNLLTVVLGNARQLQKSNSDPAVARRLDMIIQAAERGARLTGQLLAFSRQLKLEPRALDLNDTVDRMHGLLQSTIGANVHITTDLQPGLWAAMIDATQIELAILNLAINARDAMGVSGGALTIKTANLTLGPPESSEEPPAGDYVMISVSDNGPGIPDDILAKVFEPFFTTKEIGKGSGLGLSQVFGLAKQSGGGMQILTKVGQGTTVQIYLPRTAMPSNVAETNVEIAPRKRDREAVVLLVDDDHAVRQVTAGILTDLGYGIVEAGSGGAALEALEQATTVDLVLLDFAMPGMNGAEVAREIKARRPDLPIIFATGYADTDALVASNEDSVVHKPFVEQELAAKLQACLG